MITELGFAQSIRHPPKKQSVSARESYWYSLFSGRTCCSFILKKSDLRETIDKKQVTIFEMKNFNVFRGREN